MSGADGDDLKVRPSEFKGMMRFWWRAARALDDIHKLKEEENEIFGGVGKGEGKSKVWIRVFEEDISRQNELRLASSKPGIEYLLYSTILPNKKKKYIKENSTFYIELSSFEERYFNHALASLWLAIYLGGFGTRSRRGGGNIVVTEVNKPLFIDFIPTKGENFQEVAEWLTTNFRKAQRVINGFDKTNFASRYSNLSASRFIISKRGHLSWEEALNDIGNIFRDFRKEHEKQVFDSAVFGLPVRHRSGESVAGAKKAGQKVLERFQRRASPVIIKLIKANGLHYWLVIRLAGQFLPEGAVLTFKDKIQKPDYGLIEEFWSQLRKKGEERVLSVPGYLNEIVDKIK
jgi:CRISPR-associated protein Cmr1